MDRLSVEFSTGCGAFRAVDEVSFDVHAGEVVAIVGESGSGKSVTALSILGLVQQPGRIVGGRILYRGRDLRSLTDHEMRAFRGREIGMIFQDPGASLDPVATCGAQVAEPLIAHERLSRTAAGHRAIELLRRVGIPSPAERANEYPHQLSGGMRQRVAIAIALACRPSLLIADEPTTALDATIQAQILELLGHLRMELGMAMILITHDLGSVAETADRMLVMYCGQIVEAGSVSSMFARALHPYTIGLHQSIPRPGSVAERLRGIPGTVPEPWQRPAGCRFEPRCPVAHTACAEPPELAPIGTARAVRCVRAAEIASGAIDPACSGTAARIW